MDQECADRLWGQHKVDGKFDRASSACRATLGGECADGLIACRGTAQWLEEGKPTLRFDGTFARGLLEGNCQRPRCRNIHKRRAGAKVARNLRGEGNG